MSIGRTTNSALKVLPDLGAFAVGAWTATSASGAMLTVTMATMWTCPTPTLLLEGHGSTTK
jgi:hypothetical protein